MERESDLALRLVVPALTKTEKDPIIHDLGGNDPSRWGKKNRKRVCGVKVYANTDVALRIHVYNQHRLFSRLSNQRSILHKKGDANNKAITTTTTTPRSLYVCLAAAVLFGFVGGGKCLLGGRHSVGIKHAHNGRRLSSDSLLTFFP